jgi:hypothetical protein
VPLGRAPVPIAEPDGRVPHDGDQQRTGSDAAFIASSNVPARVVTVWKRAISACMSAQPTARRSVPSGPGVMPEDGGQRVAGEFRHRTTIE